MNIFFWLVDHTGIFICKMELGQAEQDIQSKKEQLEELLIQVRSCVFEACWLVLIMGFTIVMWFTLFADPVLQEPNEAQQGEACLIRGTSAELCYISSFHSCEHKQEDDD